MRSKTLFAYLVAALFGVAPLRAQEADCERPFISVMASGHVEVEADHVVLTLGVTIQDSTPTAAAAAMDARLIALTDTLVALGFPRDSLPNAGYQVTPNRDYSAGQQIVGYSANAAVTVTIWEIERLPVVIEAALAAGASDVGNLRFGASDERDALDEALRRAVAAARHDAEVIAEAAGGHLGTLIEIATPQSTVRQLGARTMEFSAAAEDTPQITPRNIMVAANVSARWVFVEN
jgi:uncharacterized protein YggE